MMKTQIILAMAIAAVLPNSHGKTHAEGLRENLANTKANPTKENVMSLATEIAGNRKHVRLLDEDARSLTDVAVYELCQIPGHAQYFADELETKRASYPPGDYKEDYRRLCVSYLIGTLPHLPSPETVKVLCGYLSDERDAPPPPEDWGNETAYPSTSALAAVGLDDMGIRGAPKVTGPYIAFYNQDGWQEIRAWYEEIKSGKRAFSFKGQSVEYRFKPDGTWISTPIANPPDDAPAPPPAKSTSAAPTRPADTPPPAATSVPARRPVWPWIAGGIVAVLAATGYFVNSRRPSDG